MTMGNQPARKQLPSSLKYLSTGDQKFSTVELKQTSYIHQLLTISPMRKQDREKGITRGSTVSGKPRNINYYTENIVKTGTWSNLFAIVFSIPNIMLCPKIAVEKYCGLPD